MTMVKPRAFVEQLDVVCACCGAPADFVPAPCGHCFCAACGHARVSPVECPVCIEKIWPLPKGALRKGGHS